MKLSINVTKTDRELKQLEKARIGSN